MHFLQGHLLFKMEELFLILEENEEKIDMNWEQWFGEDAYYKVFVFKVLEVNIPKVAFSYEEIRRLFRIMLPDENKYYFPPSDEIFEEEFVPKYLVECLWAPEQGKGVWTYPRGRKPQFKIHITKKFTYTVTGNIVRMMEHYLRPFRHYIWCHPFDNDCDGEGMWYDFNSYYSDRAFAAQHYVAEQIELLDKKIGLEWPVTVADVKDKEDRSTFLMTKDEDGHYIAEEVDDPPERYFSPGVDYTLADVLGAIAEHKECWRML